MAAYYPRIADAQLKNCLERAGAAVIRGPKWCGKTATALQQAKSVLFMQDPDEYENNMTLAEVKPSILLEGDQPRLIDEWQEAPQLWDSVRFSVDRSGGVGHYILTGSATPQDDRRSRHSGTGRFSYLFMRPMSLYESLESTAEVSLAALFSGSPEVAGKASVAIEELAYAVCRGGWPESVTNRSRKASLLIPGDYLNAVAEEDVSRIDGAERSPRYARLIMQGYARCVTTQADMASIRRNLLQHGDDMARSTVSSYVSALRRLYVLEDLEPWSPSLHAKSRIATTPTRHFADPSLAAAALGATPEMIVRDMSTFGMLFESLCVRDLRVYAAALGGEVFHYRDNTGLEADAVVVLPDGRWALFEMKMGKGRIDEGAKSLLKLASKIDQAVMGPPSFLAVVTPSHYAYRRPDGVLVVPVSCLAP